LAVKSTFGGLTLDLESLMRSPAAANAFFFVKAIITQGRASATITLDAALPRIDAVRDMMTEASKQLLQK
jgi:hypothetical protein